MCLSSTSAPTAAVAPHRDAGRPGGAQIPNLPKASIIGQARERNIFGTLLQPGSTVLGQERTILGEPLKSSTAGQKRNIFGTLLGG